MSRTTPLGQAIDSLPQLTPLLEQARSSGKSIGLANGAFDLLHVGHVRYLYGAKELGDVLIVAVNTDASMRLIKPDRRPVNDDVDRMEILAAFEPVDFVVPLSETTPESLLRLLQPDIHTKGTDYTLDRIPERVVVEEYGGRVELVGGPKERSTTEMLREISQLLAYEITSELPMTTEKVETPLVEMDAPVLEGRKLALISILRAGNGLLDGVLELIPSARVGFVGLYRDEKTLQPVQY